MSKNMIFVVILGCICLTKSAPAPFPADDLSEYPDDQVEVIGGPFSSSGEGSYPEDGDGVVRVFVVRARPTFRVSGFPDIFGGQNPFGISGGGQDDAEVIPFGGNGGFNPFSILRGGGEEDAESFPFGGEGGFNPFSVLGGRGGEEDAEIIPVGEAGGNVFNVNIGGSGEDECGPLCLIFKLIGGLQVEIDDINERDNENGVVDDGEYDINNSTYHEKVLPDGSILKTNRTTISDTDENGNTFFFKSTVIHNLDSGEDDTSAEADEEASDEEVGEVDVTADYPSEDDEASGDDETPVIVNQSPEFGGEIPDPSENEIDGSNEGIDDGLLVKDKSG